MTEEKKETGPKKGPPQKIRKWFFTIWKMDIDWEELYTDYKDIIRYIVVQKEKAPKTERLHFQGAIHFFNVKSMRSVRRILGLGKGENSGDLQPQRGSNKQVKEYCHKARTSEGFRFEFGKPSKQGFRTDLEDIKFRIEKGEDDFDICQDHFGTYARAYKWAERYRALHLEKQSRKYRNINIKFLSGPTGIGKTRTAYNNHKPEEIFKISCSDGLKWFDGYTGQKVLILDEFKNQIALTRILDLLDGYQCRLEYKGGMTYALWDTVYITTNLRKHEIYPNQSGDLLAPLWRRVTDFESFWKDKPIIKENRNEVTKGNTGPLVTSTYDRDLFSDSDDESVDGDCERRSKISLPAPYPPRPLNKLREGSEPPGHEEIKSKKISFALLKKIT